MRDQDLYAKLKNLVVRYFRYLYDSELPIVGTPPGNFVPKVKVDNNNSLSADLKSRPDFGIRIFMTLSDFIKSPDNEDSIKDILRHDDIVRLLKDKGSAIKAKALMYNVLHPLIIRQFITQDGIELNEAVFRSNYEAFEEYLIGKKDKYRLFALLDNFQMSSDEECVGPIKIRRLTSEENAAYNGDIADPALQVRDPSLSIFEFMLEMEVVVARGSTPLTQTNQNQFRWLIMLMKLLKSGSICYNTIWCLPLSWSGMSFGGGSGPPRHSVIHKPYALESQDFVKLKGYWDKVEQYVGGSEPFWMIPLQRFCDAADRYRSDEALIDYWIACESLFGENVEMGELTYRLSLRIAHFLEADPFKRKELRDIVKEAYRIRGHIMHRGAPDPKKLPSLTLEMERITRNALCKCLEGQFESREEMINRIECSILGIP